MSAAITYTDVVLLRKDIIVLENVNFTIEEGQLIYLTGKVGSGKSTLLKSIYAEIPNAAGHAEVLGYDLSKIRRRQIPYLRREIGIVFQDFRLLPDRSVYENLLFVLKATGWKDKAEREQRIAEVLHEVGMSNKSYKMPHELSGGEQQRIVLARAMLNKPRILLADEPTGNLDPDTATIIIRRLHEIAASGTTVIIATHNLSLINQFPAPTYTCLNHQLLSPSLPQNSGTPDSSDPDDSEIASESPLTSTSENSTAQ